MKINLETALHQYDLITVRIAHVKCETGQRTCLDRHDEFREPRGGTKEVMFSFLLPLTAAHTPPCNCGLLGYIKQVSSRGREGGNDCELQPTS